MRYLATVIAGLLPAETATAIQRITGNQELATLNEYLQPVADPALPEIAGTLPADAAFQITHTAERLGFTDYSDVLAEVANAVTRKTADPKDNSHHAAATLAGGSFPRPPQAGHAGTELALAQEGQTAIRSRRARRTCHADEYDLSAIRSPAS